MTSAFSSPDSQFSLFDALGQRDHEQLVFCRDEKSGLRAIVGIHSTVLGPALGGCRMVPYKSEQDAIIDVLRLSRAMTYKAAISGLNLGGGKAVIIGDPKKDKSEALWRAYGRFIAGLGGRYITAEDVGTSPEDMEHIRAETPYVVGIARSLGGLGDPGVVTALGCFSGLKAAVEECFGKSSLEGLRVAVQGLGHVGARYVDLLKKAGAKVVVADPSSDAIRAVVEKHTVEVVSPDEIYDVHCDVFSPCAMGGILNAQTIPRLKCKIVSGSANNQLQNESEDAGALADAGILYAPDFVVNAGGLINVSTELKGQPEKHALNQAKRLYDKLRDVFVYAREHDVLPSRAAKDLAIKRIESLSHVREIYKGAGSRADSAFGWGLRTRH